MRRNALLGIYDLPLWSDWLAYLTIFAIVAVTPAARDSAGELVFAVLLQFVLFGVVPGQVRAYTRKRRGRV